MLAAPEIEKQRIESWAFLNNYLADRNIRPVK